jgi:hypothetical protein
MRSSIAIKAGAAVLCVASMGAALLALLIAAYSAFFAFIHVTADSFDAGPLVWVLNPAVWSTPFLLGAAAMFFFRSARTSSAKGLMLPLALSFIALMVIWGYLRFDPLLEIDSCFDSGGAWRNGACVR